MTAKTIDVEKIIGFQTEPVINKITEKDAILYALGIGYSQDPLNEQDFQFTYERHDEFQIFPTFGTCVQKVDIFSALLQCPGMPQFNPMMLLHGEQKLEIFQPLKPEQEIQSIGKIIDFADKGKGALLTFSISSYDVKDKSLVITNTSSLFIRGLGGFGFKGKNPQENLPKKPSKNPDKVLQQRTVPNQAIIYRLSGDYNPLHIDPNMAEMGGFERPILHGLCSYGIQAKLVSQAFCDNNPNLIKSIRSRFTSHVFPGETLEFNMWKNGNQIIVSGSTLERKKEILIGLIELYEQPLAKL